MDFNDDNDNNYFEKAFYCIIKLSVIKVLFPLPLEQKKKENC